MMTSDEQLVLWLAGTSIHNKDRNECCPDFSCCKPKLRVDYKTRKAFVDGNKKLRMSMLGMFLGNAINSKKIYIAGVDEPYDAN